MKQKEKLEEKIFDLRGALYVHLHLLEVKKRALENAYLKADKLVKEINTLENRLTKYLDY